MLLLSTSNLTSIVFGYTARKITFQKSQRYNILLLCGVVNTVNIQCLLLCSSPGQENNFYIYNARQITSFGVQYDYDSVMYYGPYAFSWNGLKTIEPMLSKHLYVFMVSTCGFSGRICGFSQSHKNNINTK